MLASVYSSLCPLLNRNIGFSGHCSSLENEKSHPFLPRSSPCKVMNSDTVYDIVVESQTCLISNPS